MRIKSYFARTVESAMEMARQELGAEAMLVNSRRALPEARHLGDYEVVFASDFPENSQEEPDQPAPASPHAEPALTGERFSLEVALLKRELEQMRRVLTRSALAPPQWAGASAGLSDAYLTLTANDVNPELASEILECARSRSDVSFESALVEEIARRFTVQPCLEHAGSGPNVVALVGPPGSGKTTTLVKLAVNYGLSARRPVLLLSVDTYRVGSADQLRSYAAILGVEFQILDTVGVLAQTIEENRGKELIFIDTPGLDSADMEIVPGLARLLATRTDINTHLVLSSSVKSADLTRMVDRFEVFQPRCLLFTRLDETGSFGPILNEAARTSKPLSFFAGGQRIPEDLEVASRNRLVGLVLSGRAERERSAA